MRLSPHLTFGGDCEAAFTFYESALHGRIVTMLTYGSSPMAEQVPVEWRGKILHATLAFGEQVLMGADVLPEQQERPQGFYLLLGVDSADEAARIFRALSEKGAVRMPMQQTFWASAFGVLVDPFGIPWEITCE